MSTIADITADLKALYKEKDCGPIMIRLSWHDAGVYSTGAKTGGCPNAAMRFTDGGEGCFGANAGKLIKLLFCLHFVSRAMSFWRSYSMYNIVTGLPTVALTLLKPITDKYVGAGIISNADLWTLAVRIALSLAASR